MAEREVIVKVSARLSPQSEEAFKKLGKSAEDAGKKTEASLSKTGRESSKAAEQATRGFDKFGERLGEVGKQAAGGFGRLLPGGGALSSVLSTPGGAALGGFAGAGALLSGIDIAARTANDALRVARAIKRGEETPEDLKSLPILGRAFSAGESLGNLSERIGPNAFNRFVGLRTREDTELDDKAERAIQRRLQIQSEQEARIAVTSPFLDRRRGLESDIAGTRAEAGILRGLGTRRQQLETGDISRLTRVGGIESLLLGPGTSKLQERGGLAQMQDQIQAIRDTMPGMAKNAADAEAGVTLAVEKTNIALKQQQQIDMELARVKKDSAGQATPQLAEAQRKATDASNKVLEAEKGVLAALRAQSSVRVGQLEQTKGIAEGLRQQYRGIAQSEKLKLEDQSADFGLLPKFEQERGLFLARQLKQFGANTPQEFLEEARKFPVLQDMLRQIGLQRGGSQFQEIVQTVGADRRQREAEAAEKFFADIKLNLTNEIKIQLDRDESKLADEMIKKIIPEMRKQIELDVQAMLTAIQKQDFLRKAAQAGLTAGLAAGGF